MVETFVSHKQLDTSTCFQMGSTDSFFCRWADIQFNGSLEAVDQGIEAMVDFARVIMENPDHNSTDDAIDDLECAAFATIRELRKILALYPKRIACLPFDGGLLLFCAVSQFFPFPSKTLQSAIVSGAELAENCSLDILNSSDLSEEEISYRIWITPRIICHLIPDASDDDLEN